MKKAKRISKFGLRGRFSVLIEKQLIEEANKNRTVTWSEIFADAMRLVAKHGKIPLDK